MLRRVIGDRFSDFDTVRASRCKREKSVSTSNVCPVSTGFSGFFDRIVSLGVLLLRISFFEPIAQCTALKVERFLVREVVVYKKSLKFVFDSVTTIPMDGWTGVNEFQQSPSNLSHEITEKKETNPSLSVYIGTNIRDVVS